MNISSTFMRLGVLTLIGGMSLGIWMGATENFTLRPVHAHVNLLGFVAMMLFGLFYRTFPDAARTKLALGHFTLFVVGFLIQVPTLTLLLLGNPSVTPILGLSEIALVLSVVLFAIIVFRSTSGKPVPAPV